MATLPELLDEDVLQINAALLDFLGKTEASVVLVTAEGGFVVFQQGAVDHFDTTTLGALAANAFNAAQAIARTMHEPNFTHIYQQGDRFSLLVSGIDPYNSMVVLFPAHVSVGAVKYYASPTLEILARQFREAERRPRSRSLDLALLNLSDSTEVFKRRAV